MKRKIKQLISLSVALCLAITMFVFQPSFVNAETTETEKQMLHITMGDESSQSLVLLYAKLEKGKNYTVTFKYKNVSGDNFKSFTNGSNVNFVVYDNAERYRRQSTGWIPLDERAEGYNTPMESFDTNTSGEEGVSDIKLTFTAADNESKLGFQTEKKKTAEFYIADFKVAETETGKIVEQGLGFSKKSGTATITSETYDDSKFYEDAVTISSESGGRFGVSCPLTQAEQYKIRFKYKTNSGTFGAPYTSIRFRTYSASANTVYQITSTLGSNCFTVSDGLDGWKDIELSFTATATASDATMEFHFNNTDDNNGGSITVSDFIIYKYRPSGHATNLGWRVLYKGMDKFKNLNADVPVTVTKSTYTTEQFYEAFSDEMLKISCDNTGKSAAYYGIRFDQFGADEKCKMTFKYRIADGNFAVVSGDSGITLGYYIYTYPNYTAKATTANPGTLVTVSDSEDGWCNVEVEFTMVASDTHNNQYIHFALPAGVNSSLYVADYRFYDYNMSTGEYDLKGVSLDNFKSRTGTNNSFVATGTRMPLNEDIFKEKFDVNIDRYLNASDTNEIRTALLNDSVETKYDMNDDTNIDICDLVRLYKVVSIVSE